MYVCIYLSISLSLYIYIYIYIYTYTHGYPTGETMTTDGIGAPDPSPRNLANWCF